MYGPITKKNDWSSRCLKSKACVTLYSGKDFSTDLRYLQKLPLLHRDIQFVYMYVLAKLIALVGRVASTDTVASLAQELVTVPSGSWRQRTEVRLRAAGMSLAAHRTFTEWTRLDVIVSWAIVFVGHVNVAFCKRKDGTWYVAHVAMVSDDVSTVTTTIGGAHR